LVSGLWIGKGAGGAAHGPTGGIPFRFAALHARDPGPEQKAYHNRPGLRIVNGWTRNLTRLPRRNRVEKHRGGRYGEGKQAMHREQPRPQRLASVQAVGGRPGYKSKYPGQGPTPAAVRRRRFRHCAKRGGMEQGPREGGRA